MKCAHKNCFNIPIKNSIFCFNCDHQEKIELRRRLHELRGQDKEELR